MTIQQIPLPTIGELENDVTMDLVLGEVVYSLSLMYNSRVGRWFYSVAGVQDNYAVGAMMQLPEGVLAWNDSPETRDLTAIRLYISTSE